MLHAFRLLHVLSITTWLAASLWLASDARRSLAAGGAEANAFVGRARKAVKLDKLAGILTIVTGLGLIHFAQAWPLRGGLWLGIVMATLRAGLTDAVLSPSVRKIAAGLEAGQAPADLAPLAGKLATMAILGHVAWLLALTGMVLPF